MFERSRKGENALLIQPHAGAADASLHAEFADLARSAGATVVGTLPAGGCSSKRTTSMASVGLSSRSVTAAWRPQRARMGNKSSPAPRFHPRRS